MKKEYFDGQKESKEYYLYPIDLAIKKFFLPLVPKFIQTDHITLSMLIFVPINILVGVFSKTRPELLALFSVIIAVVHILDLLDGEIGRQRKTGLILWGFFMDKIVDFSVLGSLAVGLSLAIPTLTLLFMLMALVYGGIMLQSVSYLATAKYFPKAYSKLGPTEAKFVMMGILSVCPFLNEQTIRGVFLFVTAFLSFELLHAVFEAQKTLRLLDMKNKQTDIQLKK